MNIELPKKNSDPNQLDIFEDQPVKPEQSKQVEEKDSQGRTREKILEILEKNNFSINVVGSLLVYKDGDYYIEGMLVDEWINFQNSLDDKSTDTPLNKPYPGYH